MIEFLQLPEERRRTFAVDEFRGFTIDFFANIE
jgi:hypothetical protein